MKKLEFKLFTEWLMSDNVAIIDDGEKMYLSTQDSLFRNKLYNIKQVAEYYKKEFVNI